jgi:ankyrin repeat protein
MCTAVIAHHTQALYIAAKAEHEEAVAALLAVPDTQVNWQSSKGITAISAAAHKGRIGIVQQLIDARADVNIESNNGSTPLIQASHFGHAEVVSMLIRANANVDKPNNKGTTALMRATQEGKEEVRLKN